MVASSGRTVGSLVEEVLRSLLLSRQGARRPTSEMPKASGTPLPGVDVDDTAELLDVMAAG
jgi:hypothetical protein